ncbi:hypothetical protein GJ744_010580 [Endocarpon pusillum]|uniref:Uncharacterized protein n=1 Tax=Endocarpon pusillum TaxID=364733 RepID=A0A8H7ATC4_9EURO|nr:hypothetical protein GJ744_010580 [Endocarpon pusillum]
MLQAVFSFSVMKESLGRMAAHKLNVTRVKLNSTSQLRNGLATRTRLGLFRGKAKEDKLSNVCITYLRYVVAPEHIAPTAIDGTVLKASLVEQRPRKAYPEGFCHDLVHHLQCLVNMRKT